MGGSQITEPESTTDPKELGLASFVDETKDPQSYVDRYTNEASYKKWFDDNFAEFLQFIWDLEEPKVLEKKFGICGSKKSILMVLCTIVKMPSVKPWWQFTGKLF